MPEFFDVVTPEEALRRFQAHVPICTGTERVQLKEALGRVTSEDVHSPGDLPSFPRSTMDGYAVRAADTFGASESIPAYLNLAGEVPMGRPAGITLSVGDAAKVHTGSMLADGADAVVMVENTHQVDASTIEVVRPVAPGENVIQVGEDVKSGDLLIQAGQWLRPQDIGGLSAVGITELAVCLRPKVAILSTGDEVVHPDAEVSPGQIRDINTYTIAGLARQAGAIPVPLGIVPDDYGQLVEAVRRGLEEGDLVIISAGSSVSTRDMTAQVISSLGEPGILVHGISIKPGKPTILAVVDGKPIVGLPGNPVSRDRGKGRRSSLTHNLFQYPCHLSCRL